MQNAWWFVVEVFLFLLVPHRADGIELAVKIMHLANAMARVFLPTATNQVLSRGQDLLKTEVRHPVTICHNPKPTVAWPLTHPSLGF